MFWTLCSFVVQPFPTLSSCLAVEPCFSEVVHCRWSDTPAFLFLFFGAGGICTFLGCTYVRFLLYLSMCVFYVLCVGCGVRSAVLCAILIYERNFFNGRGALRVLLW